MSYEKGMIICEKDHTRIVYEGNDAGCPMCCLMLALKEQMHKSHNKRGKESGKR